MTRTIQIFIEGIKDSNNYTQIELFKDEAINTSLSTQNIADISKVYTDYTQSFTVPCTPINNAIFKHFYNSDVDSVEDFGIRRNAYIEIDYTPFRSGRIQLESSELEFNKAQHYVLTFYGDVLSLKDKIKDDKLSSLNFDSLTNPYTGPEIKNRITDGATNYDVRYPLISSKRLWSYGDATSTDINTNAGRIVFSELSPAVKISKILEAIETKYSIDFQGIFLTNKKFTNCFLECKNSADVNTVLHNKPIIFNSNSIISQNASFDVTNTKFNYNYTEEVSYVPGTTPFHTLTLSIYYMSNPSAVWTIDIYDNGIFHHSITGTGLASNVIFVDSNIAGFSRNVSFTIRTDINCTTSFHLDYTFTSILTSWTTQTFAVADAELITSSSNIDLSLSMPDMKITDFLSGVFKQFNLTCYPLSVGVYQVEPLDDWYSKGKIRDITTYVDEKSISIERVPRYKNVSFKRQPSESFMNKQYFELYKEEYGDLVSSFPEGEGDYTVDLPFENLLHNRFTGTQLQVGYCLTKAPDFKPYTPKPILLYMYDSQPCSFEFYNGTVQSTITAYQPFGQDVLFGGIKNSLNFGSNTSTLLNVPIQASAYSNYYQDYLSNIFNKKNRIVKCEAIFPISLITGLKLNDRLIIRDHRYIINEIKTDITTGLVYLVLIQDFRTMKPVSYRPGGKLFNGGGVFVLPVFMPNSMKSATITTTTAGVTLSTAFITVDTNVEITYPTAPNPIKLFLKEDGSGYLMTEKFQNIRSESGVESNIEIKIEYTSETKAPHNRLLSELGAFLFDEYGDYLIQEPETVTVEIINLNQA
jgi:hypothetical protein